MCASFLHSFMVNTVPKLFKITKIWQNYSKIQTAPIFCTTGKLYFFYICISYSAHIIKVTRTILLQLHATATTRNTVIKKWRLTGFLMHHVLLSTVVFSSIDCEFACIPLTEWRLLIPEKRILLRLISIRISTWKGCYKTNRCQQMLQNVQLLTKWIYCI